MSRPVPEPYSLKAALAKVRQEMRESPEWLLVIYERNRAIERALRAREEGTS